MDLVGAPKGTICFDGTNGAGAGAAPSTAFGTGTGSDTFGNAGPGGDIGISFGGEAEPGTGVEACSRLMGEIAGEGTAPGRGIGRSGGGAASSTGNRGGVFTEALLTTGTAGATDFFDGGGAE